MPESATTWPANRGRRSALDDIHDRQELTLTCGIGGCSRRFRGELKAVIRRRDRHRSKDHAGWTAPVRARKGGYVKRAKA